MQHPTVDRKGDAPGEALAVQLRALGGHEPGDVQSHGGPHAHRLLETSLKVGQVLALSPREVPLRRDRAVLHGFGHLGLEL